MKEWQQRLVQEAAELDDRIKKLSVFLGTETHNALDPLDQGLLHKQHELMVELHKILTSRIGRF